MTAYQFKLLGGRLREVPDKRGWGLADRGKAALSPLLPVGRLHLHSRPPAAEAIFLCFCNCQVSIVFFSSFSPRGTVVVDCLGRGGAPLPLLPRLAGPVSSSSSSTYSSTTSGVSTRDAISARFCCPFCVYFSILLPFFAFLCTAAAGWMTAAEAAPQWCHQAAGCKRQEARPQVSPR